MRRRERSRAGAAALLAAGGLAVLPARGDTSLHSTPDPAASGSTPPVAPPPPVAAAPRHADDPDRSAALVTSAIVFGVGAGVSSAVYAIRYLDDDNACRDGDLGRCKHPHATPWLVGYGLLVSASPSLPRAIVGDPGRALLFTGLRASALLAAVFVPWGDDRSTNWQGPFVLGFAAPVALGILDLATTPYRDELDPEPAAARRGPRLAPVLVGDRRGGLVGVAGVF